MCGIGGFIRRDTYVTGAEPALKDLVYFSRVRGIDALGAFKLNNDKKEMEWVKDAGDPALCMSKNEFKSFFNLPGDSKYFVFHNRSATRGAKDEEKNAHPYVEAKASGKGSIVLVHNGTITYNHLDKTFKGHTDSHALAKMIAAGMSIQDIEANTHGAYALVWLDTEDHSLHFTRNNERPFGFAHCKDSIWFGSELYMVGAAAARRNFRVESFEPLLPMQEWIWHFDSKTLDKRTFPLKPKVPSVNYGKYGGSGYIQNHHYEDWEGYQYREAKEEKEDKEKTAAHNPNPPKVLALPDLGKKRRPRFCQIPNYCGYERNDTVLFTIYGYELGDQGRVKLDGHVLSLGSNGQYTKLSIEVRGSTNLAYSHIHNSKKVWCGEIVNIDESDEPLHINKVKTVRFHVRKIEETDGIDYTRFPHGDADVSNDESEVAERTIVSPLEPESSTTGTATSTTSDGDWVESKPCFNCGTYFPTKDLFRPSHLDAADMRKDVQLDLCPDCFKLTICDVGFLYKLFEEARSNPKGGPKGYSTHTNQAPSPTVH